MIAVDGLCKTFGGVQACNNVSFVLGEGSRTAVVGPNGAGKSTLLQLLSGTVRPDAGRITLGTVDVTRMKTARRCSLGIGRTFQTARVFPGLTVLESVLVGAYQGVLYEDHAYGLGVTVGDAIGSLLQLRSATARQKEARARALESIALFGDRLRTRLDQLTFGLSYANRRRVELARVLAGRPKVLMLDEPTAGMNPTETVELATLLDAIKADNPSLTMILVEHKMNIVRQLSDRVIVMDSGKMIADDSPEEALRDPVVIEAYLGTSGKE